MNKKPIYWTCAVLMVLSLAFGITDRWLLARQTQQVVTLFTRIDVFAARPIFYGCLALIFSLRMFAPPKADWLRWLFLGLGLALTALLTGVGICAIADVPFTVFFFGLIRGLFQYSFVFLIPGCLLGLGLNRA